MFIPKSSVSQAQVTKLDVSQTCRLHDFGMPDHTIESLLLKMDTDHNGAHARDRPPEGSVCTLCYT